MPFQSLKLSKKMEFNSIEVHIFISCPSDVKEEKQLVKELCEQVNKDLIYGESKVRFVARDFSEIIGRVGIRPQQLINESIAGYNVYIGILFTRFGTPTGAINPETGEEFESGTEEEFYLADQKRSRDSEPPRIYFFFKDQEMPKTVADLDQGRKVLVFKEKMMKNDWVHQFKTPAQFERLLHSLLYRLAHDISTEKKVEVKQAFIKEAANATDHQEATVIKKFVPQFPSLKYYIPRSNSLFRDNDQQPNFIKEEDRENLFLVSALLREKKIALLGNAGIGKSVELQQAAKHFLRTDTPYIPIYKRLNTYTGENIGDFLPTGWNRVEPEILLLLLDGLDEVQPQYFNTAVAKITSFSEQNQDIRIVVSCRTNFYELPSLTFSGTLNGFSVYTINEISVAEIIKYSTAEFKIDGEKFILDAYENGFLDLIQKPFFLNILMKHYKQKHNFFAGRAGIIEESILSMIDLDQEHFKTTVSLPTTRKAILSLLEKVAFVMELTGKNFITDEELETILNSRELDQIRRFSAFFRNNKDQWMFEHNNIQEFLAARVLSKQSFQKLIEIIAFPPSYTKVKPTWVNTISFFISIADATLRVKLVEWLVDKEPEIIVKFEAERVKPELRVQIFKDVFNYYKTKNIWLNSNKFSQAELARFASSTETLTFLIGEIADKGNSRIVRLNAIAILDNFNLSDFSVEYKESIKDVLISILDRENPDPDMIYSILYAMAKMKITDVVILDYLVTKYRKRKNQYVRAGLYKMIHESNPPDEFIDFILDGLDLQAIKDPVEDRDAVHLADESFHLEEAIKKIRSPKSIRKLLAFFDDPSERKRFNVHDHREIFQTVLKNAFHAYSTDPSLYHDLLSIYKSLGKLYDEEHITSITQFFEKIGRKWDTFKVIFSDDSIRGFDKEFLLASMLDRNIVDKILEAYTIRDITNEHIIALHKLMIWHFQQPEDLAILRNFEEKVEEISRLKLEKPQITDWKAINKRKTQESFDLLFDVERLLDEVKSVFIKLDLTEIKNDDLWEIKKSNYREIDDYFHSSVLDLLRDFTTDDRTVSYEQTEEWVTKSPLFEDYRINQVYSFLHNKYNTLEVTPHQKSFIVQWAENTARELDIESAVYSKDDENAHISVNWKAKVLWFFLDHFAIDLPEEKILSFTMFYDFEKENNQHLAGTIEALEKFLSHEIIKKKITANLAKHIPLIYVWKSNATYAIQNDIKATFPFIVRDLKNASVPDYHRSEIIHLLYRKTQNADDLQQVLKAVTTDQLGWDIVKLLSDQESEHQFLKTYLLGVLQTEHEHLENKMNAAKYLMRIHELSGLNFFADLIISSPTPTLDFHQKLSTLQYIKDPGAIPVLVRLLKISKQPAFQQDRFNSLDSLVFRALYNIGIQSEENFIKVKVALEQFIEDNKNTLPNLNFIHFEISKVEEQIYLKKSQSTSIKEAVKEFEKVASA